MWAKIKNSLLINIGIGVIAAGILIGAYHLAVNTFGLRRGYEANQRKIAELTEQKRELEARIEELKNPVAVERIAKEKLNLKRSGEEVVVVVPESTTTSGAVSSTPWWSRFTSFFKKLSR